MRSSTQTDSASLLYSDNTDYARQRGLADGPRSPFTSGFGTVMEQEREIQSATAGYLVVDDGSKSSSLNRILHDLQMAYSETAAAMGELDADLPNLVDESELDELEEEAETEPQPRAASEPSRQPESKPQEKSAVVQESSGSKKKFVKSYGP